MNDSTHSDLPSIAELYADVGLYVFPLHRIAVTRDGEQRCGCGIPTCKDMGKHPAIKWRDGSTNKLSEVRRLWARRPYSGIGLDCGKSGLYVVDIDPKNGGESSLAELNTTHGEEWHNTRTVHTGGGGMHFYFRNLPGDKAMHNTILAPGIDTRGYGGYVVLPPTRHKSGRNYEWSIQRPWEYQLADIPQWIIQRTATKPVWTPSGKIPDGYRNATLASLAGKLRFIGLHPDAIYAALQVQAQFQCENPDTIGDRELKSMAHWQGSKATGEQKRAAEAERINQGGAALWALIQQAKEKGE